MQKKKILLVLTLVLVLLFPYNVFANHAPINAISFDELEGLLFARSRTIIDNNISFGRASSGNIQSEEAIDGILAILQPLRDGFDPLGDTTEAALYWLLDVQIKSLEQQKNSIGSREFERTMGLQTDIANNTFVWNMQMIYITCKSLEKQIAEMNAKKNVMEKQYKILEVQKDLGMVTENALLSFENQLKDIEDGLHQLKNTYDSLISQININLSQDYDTELALEDLPKVTEYQLESIDDVDQDYRLALIQSYTVRLNEDDYEKKADATRKFKSGFYNTYEILLDKQEALELQKSKHTVAEFNMKISDLKYKLGLISALQYESDKSTYTSSKLSLDIAEDALFQAYQAYQWAKRGLIVSSGTQGGQGM